MGRDDNWPATVPSVVVWLFSFCFSEAVHTTMHTMCTTKQAVPVECLNWWLFPLIHSLGQLPISVWMGTLEYPKWRNRTFDRESDGRFWIGKPRFLFEFPSNHTSISLSFGDIRVWQTDGRTSADHYYSWPPHCDGKSTSCIKYIKIPLIS